MGTWEKQSLYEMVIGLEVHVELQTQNKLFCTCPTAFGAASNTQVCPVCTGEPGALPTLNRQAVALGIAAGLALGSHINLLSWFDRKHYSYPDLPKGYQITQFFSPLCEEGFLRLSSDVDARRIGITRIHLEEDAGKLMHQPDGEIFVDLNRCGVPLIEIVTEPELYSAEEAVRFLRRLRAVLIYAGVSDCRMNEGSLRCDVNLSLRRNGEGLGVRTEMKNLNSFQSIQRAIQAEAKRQQNVLASGGHIEQETRRFDAQSGTTLPMRRKENSSDYRFLPEPDLPPLQLTREEVEEIRKKLPMLPDDWIHLFQMRYGISEYTAEQLTGERWLAEYFEQAAQKAKYPNALANLLIGEAFAQMTLRDSLHTGERNRCDLPVAPSHMAELSNMIAMGDVNSSIGKHILSSLFDHDENPRDFAARHGLETVREERVLCHAARQAVEQNPALLQSYRAGKERAARAIMGKAMALTGGRADAQRLEFILMKLLREGAQI